MSRRGLRVTRCGLHNLSMRSILVAVLVVSSVSFAQTSAGTKEKRQPKTEIIFDTNDLIDGETAAPLGSYIDGRDTPQFESMIRVRKNFADKLRASVNELK
jgi:hypothetical protein